MVAESDQPLVRLANPFATQFVHQILSALARHSPRENTATEPISIGFEHFDSPFVLQEAMGSGEASKTRSDYEAVPGFHCETLL